MHSRRLRPKPIPETTNPLRPPAARDPVAQDDPVLNGRDLLLPGHCRRDFGDAAPARHVQRRQDQHVGSRHDGGRRSRCSCRQHVTHQSLSQFTRFTMMWLNLYNRQLPFPLHMSMSIKTRSLNALRTRRMRSHLGQSLFTTYQPKFSGHDAIK